jgi:small membrane protein
MRLFQLIALPFIAVMLAISIRNLFKVPARFALALFWVLLWLATLVAVMYPNLTTQLARALGIYRGADLLVYSAVLAFILGFYMVSIRLRQMSREITVLTREVALLEAERKQDSPPGRRA